MDTKSIKDNAIFRRLSFERRCLGGVLAFAMATVYFAYVLTIAFLPALLGVPLHENSVITWGIVVGAALLSFGFVLTAIYVLVANTRLNALGRLLQEDLQ
jgi:uncharacterized membrane protein (DUF485 family)